MNGAEKENYERRVEECVPEGMKLTVSTEDEEEVTRGGVKVRIRPLASGCGARIEGLGAAEILEAMEEEEEEEEEEGNVNGHETKRIVEMLADALREHGLLWFRGSACEEKRSLSPAQIRALYMRLHSARFPEIEFSEMKEDAGNVDEGDKSTAAFESAFKSKGDGNISRSKIPNGYHEMTLLGYNLDVQNYHGLSGRLEPVAWWEKDNGEFHHDGAFNTTTREIPFLVVMYCEETPTPGAEKDGMQGTTMRCWGDDKTLYCPPGSTLFYRTSRAMHLASPKMARRARRMRCVYIGGFDRVKEHEYPIMSPTYLTAMQPPIHQTASESDENSETKEAKEERFTHALVQTDPETGAESVLVTWTCLSYLEELDDENTGSWRQLEYEEGRLFIEDLLGPAASPPYVTVVDYMPGDYCIFDNIQISHAVTPTNAYADGSHPNFKRMMIRAARKPLLPNLQTI